MNHRPNFLGDYPLLVRTFASADTFIESSQSSLRLGRLVANATFLEALLRHGPYDRFEFFCGTDVERSRLREWIERLPIAADLRGRVELRTTFELPARMAVADWEVVHSGGWSRYLPALAWLRARFAARAFPLTGTIHSLNDPSMGSMLRRLGGSPLTDSDAVICTSLDGRESFRRQLGMAGVDGFPARLEIAPLGVDERYFARRDRIASRRRLGIAAEARVALWIGRLSAASKADLHPLVYQWSRLVQETPRGSRILVLSGGGAQGDVLSLRQTVAELGLDDVVRIRPDVEDDEKLDLLAAADVFVSPVDNHQETFGISVVEAMAAGLPVVASAWDGYKDLVQDGVTGILVPVRWTPPPSEVVALRPLMEPQVAQLALSQGVAVDPARLTHSLRSLLDDPQLARSMGEAGRVRAESLFSWKVVVERLSGIWRDLQERSRSNPVPRAPGGDPDILDPAEAFGHYADPARSTEFRVRISSLGLSVLSGAVPMPPTFGDVLPISDGRLLTALVVGLREGPRSAGEHVRACALRAGRDEPQARWLLHWLLKYGIVEEDDRRNPSSGPFDEGR